MNEVLTADLVKVIFSKLPFSNLWICRVVCKAWNRLVLDYALSSKFHHKKSLLVFSSEVVPNPGPGSLPSRNPNVHSMDFGTNLNSSVASLKFHGGWNCVSFYCSCNGLLYIAKSTLHDCCDGIWNPMTNEFLQLPGFEGDDRYYYGFGFSPKTNQYKLFRVDSDESLGTKIEIWRFGTSNESWLWEHIGWHPPPQMFATDGAYLDGVIYWMTQVLVDGKKKKKHVYFMNAFDVETETFETRYPSDIGPCSNTTDFGIQLMSVDGKLQVIIGPCIRTAFKIELKSFNGQVGLIITMFKPIWKMCVWIMREHSWIKEFVVDLPICEYKEVFFIEALGDEISLFINDDFYTIDKNGKMTIKTSLNLNRKRIQEDVSYIEFFQFGSLSRILTGDY